MNVRRILSAITLATALPALAFAQTQDAWHPDESEETGNNQYAVEAALAEWRSAHGDNWRMVFEPETGFARFLYGGNVPPLFAPRSDADFFVLAREALLATRPMHGVDLSSLVENSVIFLPLGNAGSTDKMSVEFRQEVAGVPVVHGFANVLFDMQGRLLSVDVTGLPNLGRGFSTTVAVDAGDAVSRSLEQFVRDTGLPPNQMSTPALVIDQWKPEDLRLPRLAWDVEVAFYGENMEPEGFRYRVDALTGAVLDRATTIHNDVSGTVRSLASPGLLPDTAANPEQNLVMPRLRITSSAGNAITDANGNFNIPGASAPLAVTVSYDGPFATTTTASGTKYSLNIGLGAASGNQIGMNPTATATATAEANAFLWINLMRDWTRAVNPADATSDFLALANCNLSQTCNAFFNGSSVNFYAAGGSCPNTAYSTVVLHEMGHWLNVKYSSGNGPDGFGEGNADNFSTFIADNPIIGQNFCGTGCNIRTGLNTRQFCGDNNPGCYGGVHADGEVLMGAFWKWRTNLKNTHGAAAGSAIANTLFNAWMNAYNDSQIRTIIETHILTLDDDDGNIDNGTPNYADIDAGFRAQGFPGFPLVYVSFSNVTILGTTQNEVGPYTVNADMTANLNPPLANATLRYRVNSGAFNTVPMSFVGGSTWTADIPGQVSPAKVEYYLTAADSGSGSGAFPVGAPTTLIKFIVGIETIYLSNNFEGGASGWTSGGSGQDDWQISSQFPVNISYGKAGDPTTPAVSGTVIWGNDLGPSGWNGFYANNVNNYLRSPFLDLSQATGATLRLNRWLTVQASTADQARIRVNGQQVWINPTTNLIDTAWQPMEIDISAIADGNPSVQIEFGLQTNASTTFGGWNIDDVQVVTVEAACAAPVTYCTPKMTSTGNTPLIGSTGAPKLSSNGFALTLTAAMGNQPAISIHSFSQAAAPFQGGTLCLSAPVFRSPAVNTDIFGFATIAVPIDGTMPGTTRHYQWWFRDPGDAFGTGLSDAMTVTFCN